MTTGAEFNLTPFQSTSTVGLMQRIADAAGQPVIIGLRPQLQGGWFVHCASVEVDGADLHDMLVSLAAETRTRLERVVSTHRPLLASAQRALALLDGDDRAPE